MFTIIDSAYSPTLVLDYMFVSGVTYLVVKAGVDSSARDSSSLRQLHQLNSFSDTGKVALQGRLQRRLFFICTSHNRILHFYVCFSCSGPIAPILEGSKFDIAGRALSGLLRWIGTIERSASSLRAPSGHFRMRSNKNNYVQGGPRKV